MILLWDQGMEKRPSQALFHLIILFIVLSCSQFRCSTKESRLCHILLLLCYSLNLHTDKSRWDYDFVVLLWNSLGASKHQWFLLLSIKFGVHTPHLTAIACWWPEWLGASVWKLGLSCLPLGLNRHSSIWEFLFFPSSIFLQFSPTRKSWKVLSYAMSKENSDEEGCWVRQIVKWCELR